MAKNMKRRDFLKYMGLGASAVGAAAVTGNSISNASSKDNPAVVPGVPTTPQIIQELTADEMDEHHKEGVDIFLNNIGQDPMFWRPPMEYTMDGDVKVFDITVSEIEWETEPGMSYPAFAYNGMVPGPTIRVTEGDTMRVNVTNEMNQSHAVHWHGLYVPNDQDGVPYINQDPIKPGATYTYEFQLRNAGSHMYHSHHNSAEQTTRGLLGAIIVDPADTSREPQHDSDYIIILNDSALGFTLNGKSFPYTQPIIAQQNERVRIRFMNEGLMIHPMHLHGMPMMVFAKDGWNLPVPYMCDTLNIAPGERYDVIVEATELGAWAFHCHILSHAESRDGMFGMVTAFVVQ